MLLFQVTKQSDLLTYLFLRFFRVHELIGLLVMPSLFYQYYITNIGKKQLFIYYISFFIIKSLYFYD